MTCPLLNKLVENRRGVALVYREKGVAHSPNPKIFPKTFGVGTNHLNGLCFQITPLGSNYMMQIWWMRPALVADTNLSFKVSLVFAKYSQILQAI